jgi:hypothetical protein
MSGRPVHLLAAATIAAAASVFSAGSAFANCYSCGPSVGYQAPMVSYSAPVVYGYSYQAPVAYPAPVQYSPGCGCAAQSPMYVVNQGPAYNEPVVGEADPIPAYEPGYEPSYRRAYPYYSGGYLRWHHRGWNRGYGYRGYGERSYGERGYGYRGYGMRGYGMRGYGYRGYEHRGLRYRGFGQRYGVMPGARYGMRHPMVGAGGIYRGGMNRMHDMHHPMMGGMRPGSVHPMGAPKQKMP